MSRHANDNHFMVSPMRSGEMEESAHSDNKKFRNRHLVIINQLRKKEDTWDNRFYLDNIPEYNFIEDKHCETYKKILVKKKSRKFVLKKETKNHFQGDMGVPRRRVIDESSIEPTYKRPESQDKQEFRVRGIYPNEMKSREKTRAESMRRYTPLTETLFREKRAQQEKLLSIWDRFNIPLFHRDTFLKCENTQNMKQTIEILKREIDELESNCSPIQLAIRAITARENCLKQLKSLASKLQNHFESQERDQGNEEEMKEKASELLTHVRILSLNAVETILKWREYIQQAYYITRGVVKANQTIIIPFLYNEINYLLKMKNDTRDLCESSLSRYFNFSAKSDPFLVYPSKELENPNEKLVLYISKNLINRIRACELVILEESVHEHMNEKNSVQNAHHLGKPLESPSDRSLQKHDESGSQKKNTNIKIRNTTLATSAKGGKRNTAGTYQSNNQSASKYTNSSHPGSHNQLSEAEVDKKKEYPMESKIEAYNHIHDLKPEKSETQVNQEKEKSPKKIVSPQKETEKVEKIKLEEDSSPKTKNQFNSSSYVEAIDLYEDEVEEYVNLYLKKIDNKMKESFISDPKALLERANLGQDPIWFNIIDPSQHDQRAGFAVAHIDNTIFTARRMVILHFTTENRDNYQELLSKFVDYLFINDECNEIKISLYYIEDENNNLGADKQLQDCIKKLGFRWKQLTNDKYTNKRYIDYILKRPENVVAKVQKNNDEPIHVKSVVVLSDLQGETAFNKAPKHFFDNRYPVLTAALKHCDEKIDKLGEGDSKRHRNYLQVISSLIKEGGQEKIGDLTGKFKSLEEMQGFITEKFKDKQEFVPAIDSKHSNNIYSTSLLNLIYRWKSFNITHHAVNGKDRKYVKINNTSTGELLLHQSKFKNSSVYLIPTDDEQVNVFVTDNEALIKDIINQEEIVEEIVSKIFSKLEKNPTPFQQDLWLPIFSLKENNMDLDAAKTLLKDEYKINYATTSCTIGLNGSRVPGNLKVRPDENSKIIEKPFLFGNYNLKLNFDEI